MCIKHEDRLYEGVEKRVEHRATEEWESTQERLEGQRTTTNKEGTREAKYRDRTRQDDQACVGT